MQAHTCVGVLVGTKYRLMPLQFPLPSFFSPAKNCRCSVSLHGCPFLELPGWLELRGSLFSSLLSGRHSLGGSSKGVAPMLLLRKCRCSVLITSQQAGTPVRQAVAASVADVIGHYGA